jgi:hypothetical protein
VPREGARVIDDLSPEQRATLDAEIPALRHRLELRKAIRALPSMRERDAHIDKLRLAVERLKTHTAPFVEGPAGLRLVDAGGQGLATAALSDKVWDQTASHQSEYKEYNTLPRDDGGLNRHLAFFRSGWPSEHTDLEEQTLPTCSENPTVDRCPVTAGVDVNWTFRLEAGERLCCIPEVWGLIDQRTRLVDQI